MSSGDLQEFSTVDYTVFSLTLAVSLVIGLFYACRGNTTTTDYLLAGRSMSAIPIAFSITATYLSSISILGFIGEVYGHGIQMIWFTFGSGFGILVSMYTSVPIFYNLKITSISEYLELRYQSVALRKLISVLNCVLFIVYLGICLYAPTLALDAVTSLSMWVYIPVLGTIVTLYSSLGGLKAVVWTDTFQAIVIVAGVFIATIFAIITVGGFENMISIGSAHGRTSGLDFSVGIYTRHTVVNTALMGFLNYLAVFGYGQYTVQRVSTIENIGKVRTILFLNIISVNILLQTLIVCGLAIFSVYAGCDPISQGFVKKKDQMLIYFVVDYLGHLKGVPGLFVASLFCATLSSISSVLNSVVALLWEDHMKEHSFFNKMSESNKTITNKIMTFTLGAVMVGLAYIFTSVSGMTQATLTIQGTLIGSVMGVYILGQYVPFSNKYGAAAGTLASIAIMCTLSVGAIFKGQEVENLPLYTDKCNDTEWRIQPLGGDTQPSNLTHLHYTQIKKCLILRRFGAS